MNLAFYNSTFNDRVDLSNSTFKEKITFSDNDAIENEALKRSRPTIFKKQIKAQNTKFKKDVIFKNAIFEDIVDFKNSKFEGGSENFYILDFSNSKFYGDAYFNNSYFKNYADFHECEFAKVGNFFNVTSENCVNFSSSIFKDFNKINFINFDSSKIDFKNIEDCNQNLCNKSNLDEKILMVNSLRDSFRVIKHSLSSVNNFLEASKFHKLELYAKEIELDYQTEKNFKNLCSDNANIEEPTNTNNSKDKKQKDMLNLTTFIDYLILCIYRQTSDHHTNFTKIFNFTIMMIAIYGFMNFIIDKRLDYEISQRWIMTSFVILSILSIVLMLLPSKKYKFISMLLFFPISIFLLIFFHFIFFKNEIGIEVLFFVFLYLFFIISGIYIFSITNNLVVLMSRLISYIAFLTMLVLMPVSIIPFANLSQLDNQKFLKECLKNDIVTRNSKDDIVKTLTIKETFLKNSKLLKDENKATKDNNETLKSIVEAINKDYKRDRISKSTSFVYIFILALCLYSLQKTGRRNSIVSA